jgi:hypothetical protein
MKKDFLMEKKSYDAILREEDAKLLGKRARIFVNDEFIDTLIEREAPAAEEKMIGLQSDLLSTQRLKTQWFEGNYYPVVGTSLLFELHGGELKPKLISKMTDSFVIARKRQGPIPPLAEKTLLNPMVDKNLAFNQLIK